tara:strand:+ start:11286 stop:12473 length:1188 start_codon:yes stop_codon:yes gene_type:complete
MLEKLQSKGLKKFDELGFPSKKLENWKFSSSKHLKKYNSSYRSDAISLTDKYKDKYTLCFFNGQLLKESLENFIYRKEITISDIKSIDDKSITSTSSNYEKEALFNLGLATIESGKYFEFDKNATFDKPIQIINFFSKDDEDLRIASYNIFKINEGNNVSIIEKDINSGAGSFNLCLNKFICSDNSILNHSMLYDDKTRSNYLGYNYYEAGRNTVLNIDNMNINSSFNKNFIEVDLNKEGSEVKINVLNLVRNDEHLDNNILINHKAEHCISFQNVRNILDNEATSVFNGKVIVSSGAQKTDSNQSNKNLLLSTKATAHSNPQLEIYADDVKCGHGSTTGALDKDSIFYLRARGINEKDATNILVKAFAKEILDEFDNEDIRKLSEENLNNWIDG